jgi:hypothetical protein
MLNLHNRYKTAETKDAQKRNYLHSLKVAL